MRRMHQHTAITYSYIIVVGCLSALVERSAAQEGNNVSGVAPPENDLPKPRKKKSEPVFGTLNGYDVGGDDPVCWESSFSADESNFSSTDGSSLEILNVQLFDADDNQVRMLPSCPNETMMTVIPEQNLTADFQDIFEDEGQKVMYMDEAYTFRLQVEVDLYSVLRDNHTLREDIERAGVLDCHARLRLCDALNQGFCNPLTDTTERDQNITLRSETDYTSEDSEAEELPQNDLKWNYTEGTVLLGVWGDDSGRTIDSRWIHWEMQEQNETEDIFRAQVDISLRLPRSTVRKGTYFLLGHIVIYFELDNGTVQRLDVAQTIPDHTVHVQPSPKILTVTKSAKIWLGVTIGVLGSFALYCLVFILHYRSHDVMKLSQGSFLAAMAAACLVQTVFSFTFLPSRDVFCHLRGIVRVPLTFLGAILVGRVWRSYSVLNIASSLGRKRKSNGCLDINFVRFLDFLAASRCTSNSLDNPGVSSRHSLRRAVTRQESWRLVIMLTIPQFILQVIGVALWTDGLHLEYSSDGKYARSVCNSEAWLDFTGTGIVAFVYSLAIWMAWIARDLPSAFNEKDQIFNTSVISSIVAVMSIALGQFADEPTTSPDVVVFLRACVTLCVTTSVLVIIIWPKVNRVRSGDKIVMSKLLGAQYSLSDTLQKKSETSPSKSGCCAATTIENGIEALPAPERIPLCGDDPVPRHIEKKIFYVQDALRNVTNQCGDGRGLTQDMWSQMCDEVANLKADLDLVDFESTGENFANEG